MRRISQITGSDCKQASACESNIRLVNRFPDIKDPAADRHFGIVLIAWTIVLVLCGFGALHYFLLLKWHGSRPIHGGDAPMLPAVSFSLDYLFAVWLILPGLGCMASVFTAFVSWRSLFESRKMPVDRVRRGLLASGAIVASMGALALLALILPSVLATATRSALCRTTTFQTSLSPNSRYQASVMEVDCGAMSNFNRQVILTRIPFTWASQSILFFNGQPTLHLSWSGRMLTIQGEESLQSLARPPPDPMVWGGIMARYIGPKKGAPSQ
jgi:hypothetical protein